MKKQFSLCLSAFLAIAFLMTALPLARRRSIVGFRGDNNR